MRDTQLSEAAVNAQCDALAQLLDGGFLRIYSGPQPENSDEPITRQNAMLVELLFANPSAPNAIGGIVEFYPFVLDAYAVNAGRAEWFRAYASDGVTPVLDGTVSDENANLNLDEIDILVGQPVMIAELTHTIERSASDR